MRDLTALALSAALLTPIIAHAAAAGGALPGGPDALPGQVVGVVGSGDQMTLSLRPSGAAPARILKIGDEFQDGWKLTALTPSAATLTKAGASRTVGLNPSGSLGSAQAAASLSTVTVVSGPRTNAEQAAATVQSATSALQQARAALDAATAQGAPPETRQALQMALNRAQLDQVTAQNAQIRAVAILNGADPATVGPSSATQARIDAQNAALAAQNAALRAQSAAAQAGQ